MASRRRLNNSLLLDSVDSFGRPGENGCDLFLNPSAKIFLTKGGSFSKVKAYIVEVLS